MAWCAVRSFNVPAVDMRALRTRAPLAVGAGFASVASTALWRSPKRSLPFACFAISTDSRELSLILFPLNPVHFSHGI